MTNKKDKSPFLASNVISTHSDKFINNVLGLTNSNFDAGIEIPVYEDDCINIDICPNIFKKCKAGANPLICERCSSFEINQIKAQSENQPSISINSSQNVNIGKGNIIQITNIDDIPEELITEFKALFKDKSSDKTKLLQWLEKFNTVGGTVNLLIDLLRNVPGL